jgi:hypothetical protein
MLFTSDEKVKQIISKILEVLKTADTFTPDIIALLKDLIEVL